jgi:hypothetical protein
LQDPEERVFGPDNAGAANEDLEKIDKGRMIGHDGRALLSDDMEAYSCRSCDGVSTGFGARREEPGIEAGIPGGMIAGTADVISNHEELFGNRCLCVWSRI